MKILYISNLYSVRNSSAAIRNNSLVKGLMELGHTVDVLTVRQSEYSTSPDLKNGNIIYTELFNMSIRNGMKKVVNIKIKNYLGRIYESFISTIHFPDSYYAWPRKICAEEWNKYDLLISSSDGKISHFVARKIKKEYPALKWIQVWGDPWMDDLNSNFWDKIRIKHYEQKFISEAYSVVYISLPTCELMKQKYPKLKNKIVFIPRSFFNSFVYNVKLTNECHILYTGALFSIYGRNIMPLASAIEKYNIHNTTKIVLDIFGSVDDSIKKSICSTFIKFHDGVDISLLGDIYEKSNALLYISNKASSTQIPGKFYDYLGTSSLIICLVNNLEDDIAKFLLSVGDRCILVVNDENSILSILPTLVNKMQMTYSPNEYYSPKHIASLIAQL